MISGSDAARNTIEARRTAGGAALGGTCPGARTARRSATAPFASVSIASDNDAPTASTCCGKRASESSTQLPSSAAAPGAAIATNGADSTALTRTSSSSRVGSRSRGSDEHVAVAAHAHLGAQRRGGIVGGARDGAGHQVARAANRGVRAGAVHQHGERGQRDAHVQPASAVEPQLAVGVRAAHVRRQAVHADELGAAFRDGAQRGDATAVVGVERRRLARERRAAHDLAPCGARARAQLHERGDRIGGQRLEEQLARREQHPRRDDVDGAANARVRTRFGERCGDRNELERQRSARRGREHPAERPHPRGVRRAADHAGVRTER